MNNVNFYVGCVMICGVGFMFDVVNNIEYLLGQEFEGIEFYIGKFGVINLSIGVLVEEGCFEYVQEFIFCVVVVGWIIVVFLGNEIMLVVCFVLVNCEGVILVGFVIDEGVFEWFSNYGDGFDFVVVGDYIVVLCEEGDFLYVCYWDGILFLVFLVVGLVIVIQLMIGVGLELIIQVFKVIVYSDMLGEFCVGG